MLPEFQFLSSFSSSLYWCLPTGLRVQTSTNIPCSYLNYLTHSSVHWNNLTLENSFTCTMSLLFCGLSNKVSKFTFNFPTLLWEIYTLFSEVTQSNPNHAWLVVGFQLHFSSAIRKPNWFNSPRICLLYSLIAVILSLKITKPSSRYIIT